MSQVFEAFGPEQTTDPWNNRFVALQTKGKDAMSDQAESLRHLFAAKHLDEFVSDAGDSNPESNVGWTIQADHQTEYVNHDPALDSESPTANPPRQTRVLCLASGKGGAGTSILSLNLAVALANKGERVALVDGDYGLGQLEILCDRRPTVDLEDVLSGRITPQEALVEGPQGIRLLAGSHAARMNEAWLVGPATDELLAQVVVELRDSRVVDWILVDAGSGLTARSQTLAAVADGMILVSTTEHAAIAASHALLSHLRRAAGSHLRLVTLINKSASHKSGNEAADRLIQAARLFQGLSVGQLGVVRDDFDVPRAVRNRIPVVQAPGWWLSTAARDIERIATKIHNGFETWDKAATDMPVAASTFSGYPLDNHELTNGVSASETASRKAG